MTAPLIISFYTADWEYPQHAARLISECKAHGHEYHIVEKPTTGDYIKNTAIKPFFIREALLKFKRPVFWVDVDALLLKPLVSPPAAADLAACRYSNENLTREWAVATLWVNYNPTALAFLDEWCAQLQSGTDEAAFDMAWQKMKDKVIIHTLPETHHFVKWSHRLEVPDDTVICHQLSKSPDKMRRKQQNNG